MKRFNWGLVLAFAVSIGIWIIILTLCCCHPASQIMEPHLIMEGDIQGSQMNGIPYIKGNVTNVGGETAYDAWLYITIKETGDRFDVFLKDIRVGDTVVWKLVLEEYNWRDKTTCQFSFGWRGK